MPKPERTELPGIEGLRLVASVAVMMSHFTPYAAPAATWNEGLRIFVDVFFVISGIVIYTAYASRVGSLPEYGLYLQRRLARLYPLHAATMLFYIVVATAATAGVFKVVNPERYDPAQLPLYLTLTQAWFGNGRIAWNAVSWSISAEFFVYILFPYLMVLIRGSALRSFLIAFVILGICIVTVDVLFDKTLIFIQSRCSWLRALPSFAFGIALAVHKDKLTIPASRYGNALACTACILLIASAVLDWPDIMKLMLAWISVTLVYGVDLSGMKSLLGNSFFAGQGRLTYSLYLIHPIFATTWLAFLAPKLGFKGTGMWLAVAIAIVATFALSHLSFTRFEEPLRRRLGRPWFAKPKLRRQLEG